MRDLLAYRALSPGDDASNPNVQASSAAERIALQQLTRVSVETLLAGVAVSARRVDDSRTYIVSARDGRTHYAAPGELEFFVTARGHAPLTRRLQLLVGPQRLVVDEGDSAEPQFTEDARRFTLRRLEPPSTPSTTLPSSAARPLRPWILPAAVSAGAFAALGVSFSVWYAADRSAYDRLLCNAPGHGSADCRARYDDLNTAEGLGITAFVLAGALTATAVTLWLLDHRAAASPSVASRVCSVVVGGVRCVF